MGVAFPWDAVGLATCDVHAERVTRRAVGGTFSASTPIVDALVPLITYGRSDGSDGGPATPGVTDEARWVDVRLLARSLLPTLGHHDLDTVAASLATPPAGSAHALLLEVLARLLSRAAQLAPEHRGLLQRLLPQPAAGLLKPLADADTTITTYAPLPQPAAAPAAPERDAPSLDDALGIDGPLAKDLPGFEPRDGQLAMAQWIETCIASKRSLAVEAGPGTGKTFAYLVPLLLHLRARPEVRAIVSTRTRQLQEQLYREDLPFLARRLAPRVRSALLKGRDNYLCLRQWERAVVEFTGALDRELAHELAPVATWLVESSTGDVEENAALLAGPARDRLWPRLRDDGRHCLMSVCPHVGDCFSVRARRRAQRAQLVIVNHALLLADAQVNHRILGSVDVLIVDEAHALEEAARDAFSRSLSRPVVDGLVARIGSARGGRGSWLRRAASSMDPSSRKEIDESVRDVRRTGRRLFARLDEILPADARARVDDLPGLDPADRRHREDVIELQDRFKRLPEIADEELRAEKEILALEIRSYLDLQQHTLSPPPEDSVRWSERRPEGLVLHLSPLHVGERLAAQVYDGLSSLILTSATLTPREDRSFLRDALGLGDAPGGLSWFDAPPAFSYRDRMRIYVPRSLPPVEGDLDLHADALAALIERLLRELDRKMLVLFTSYQMLRAVSAKLPRSAPILAQRPREGRSQLVDRLRSAQHGTALLGTDTFWEGVDLPGEELELLVIARLPFPVPTDPIYSALAERLRDQGLDPFADLALPRAALKLRQGVGRLLRTIDDRGAVIITDDRLLRRPYGATLAASLPIRPEAAASENDLLTELLAWFSAPAAGEPSDRPEASPDC
ncbi:MAG: DEAD/DEAH box helicase [Candidatus Bipolaricaulota bacterium]|nr:MAG: DEAD/DEAH box helicase [Candidatus Bipolaricaulota bacterium]